MSKKWYFFIILFALFNLYFYSYFPFQDGKARITAINTSTLVTGGMMGSAIFRIEGEGNFFMEICEDSQCSDTEGFGLKGEALREYQIIPTAGEKNYTFNLYSGSRFFNRRIQDTRQVKIKFFTPVDLPDRDSLSNYQETRNGTNTDTDNDGITDDKDPYPLRQTTSLSIPDNHNQEVFIDGKYAGRTPLFLPYVPTGNHALIIKNNESAVNMSLTLIAKVPHTVTLSPEKHEVGRQKLQPGKVENVPDDNYVYFLTNPQGAEVYINDVFRGITPGVIESSPGEHTLTIRKQGYREYTATVELKAGKRIAITLERE